MILHSCAESRHCKPAGNVTPVSIVSTWNATQVKCAYHCMLRKVGNHACKTGHDTPGLDLGWLFTVQLTT